jgi:ferritin-like metal-binding protein YciE
MIVKRRAGDEGARVRGLPFSIANVAPTLRMVSPRAARTARIATAYEQESRHMAQTGTLHDAFLNELRDIYDAEKQLTKALPKMAKAAASAVLRDAFQSHLEETRGHVERIEQVMESLGEKARGKHCDGMEGIIDEGRSIMGEDFDDAAMDASLIAAGQRVEHYEIAAYGTLVAWARAMGHTDQAELLQETLDEEKAADEKLTSLAEGGINQDAADVAHPELKQAAPVRKTQRGRSTSRTTASARR